MEAALNMTKLSRTHWDGQQRGEMDTKALANLLYAAMVAAEHANSPDIADALLPLHHQAILRFQQIETTAAA